MAESLKIAVLGAGSWGTALAALMARHGHAVTLWGRDAQAATVIDQGHENVRYLPGIPLPASLRATTELTAALHQADLVLVVVPSHAFTETLRLLAPLRPPAAGVAWATKGFETGSGRFLHEVAEDILGATVPLSVVTSRERLGQTLRRIGLFLTPEETTPNPELMSLAQHLDEPTDPDTVVNGTYHGLREAVLDPYVNAIHVALLREKLGNPHDGPAFAALGAGSERLRTLAEKLLIEGPEQLSPEERLGILSDPEVMVWLHSAAWTRSPSQLAAWWESE